MKISGLFILLILCVPLIAVITVVTMRFIARKFGVTEIMNNGVVLTPEGIKYMGFFFTGTRKRTFAEIKSVELVPYFNVVISMLLFRYGLNCAKVPPNFFGEIVVIRLKRANPYEYLFFTPKNASSFVEQLKQQINKA